MNEAAASALRPLATADPPPVVPGLGQRLRDKFATGLTYNEGAWVFTEHVGQHEPSRTDPNGRSHDERRGERLWTVPETVHGQSSSPYSSTLSDDQAHVWLDDHARAGPHDRQFFFRCSTVKACRSRTALASARRFGSECRRAVRTATTYVPSRQQAKTPTSHGVTATRPARTAGTTNRLSRNGTCR